MSRFSDGIGFRPPLPSDNPEAKLLWTAAAQAAAFPDHEQGKAGAALPHSKARVRPDGETSVPRMG